jgi:hypothetical protein
MHRAIFISHVAFVTWKDFFTHRAILLAIWLLLDGKIFLPIGQFY